MISRPPNEALHTQGIFHVILKRGNHLKALSHYASGGRRVRARNGAACKVQLRAVCPCPNYTFPFLLSQHPSIVIDQHINVCAGPMYLRGESDSSRS